MRENQFRMPRRGVRNRNKKTPRKAGFFTSQTAKAVT
jgi:hypothetical protein